MSSVTFPTAIGGDGSTVTDDDNATTGLRNGGWRTRFIPCFTNLVNIADYIVSYTAQTSTFAEPPPMGSTTPNTGAFTRVTVTGSTAPVNGLYLPAANALGFATNSTERVRIDSSGNVGIGTSSTTNARLTVGGTVGLITSATRCVQVADPLGGVLLLGKDNTDYSGLLHDATNQRAQWIYRGGVGVTLDSSGNLGLGVTPSGWGTWSSVLQGNAYALTGYNASGNVQAALWCNSYRNSGGTNTYYSNGYATQYLQGSGTHAWFNAPSGTAGNAISFTQAMTLDASGNLLVGATSGGSGKLRVTADTFASSYSSPSSAYFYSSNSSDATCVEIFQGRYNKAALAISANNTGTQTAIVFYENAVAVGSVTTTTTNTAFNTSSDQRLKTNITPAGSAIQSILDFPVDQFDWISSGEHQDFGGVAQKVLPIIPEMVSVPADPDEMWGIDWSKAVPRLIKTIQELSAELNELKKRIN